MADPGYKLPVYEDATQGNFDQWLRKWTLTLNSANGSTSMFLTNSEAGTGELRMTFEVRQADYLSPNTAVITVYNLSDETAMTVMKEYTKVNLQAGYTTGHYGVVFEGTIKQFKKGRESAIDSYLKIFAADGDVNHRWSTVNQVLPAGWKPQDMQDLLVKRQEAYGVERGKIDKAGGVGPGLPRPAAAYGQTVNEAEAYTATTRQTWSIQNGKIVIQPLTAYAPGDIVVINAGTGMIGIPEVTQDGIEVMCLLNPSLFIKGRVQLDNRTFNQTLGPGGKEITGQSEASFPNAKTVVPMYASTSNDGIYCMVVIEHHGDTRGLEWYSRLLCWSIDGSSPAGTAVQGQKEGDKA